MKNMKLVVNYLDVPNEEVIRIYPHLLGRNYFIVKSDKDFNEIESFIDVVVEVNDICEKLFKRKQDEDYPFKLSVIMPDNKFSSCLELHGISCYAKSELNKGIANRTIKNKRENIIKVKHRRFRRKNEK